MFLTQLRNLQIRTQVRIAVFVLAALVVLVGASGMYGVAQSNGALRETRENQMVSAMALADAQLATTRARLALDQIPLPGESVDVQATVKRASGYMDESDAAWNRYMALPRDHDENVLAAKVAARREEFMEQGIRPLEQALLAHDNDLAAKMMKSTMQRLQRAMLQDNDKLVAYQDHVAQTAYETAQQRYGSMRALSIGLMLIGAVIAVICARSLNAAIVKPIEAAVNFCERIAHGDLTAQIGQASRNEIGRMMAAIAAMQRSLTQIVAQVRGSTDAIAGASSQIASGNLDLSQRTEEQAASLEETASSMEELTSTVRQNADNARQASGLAANATDTARKGGEVVGRVVNTMDEIAGASSRIVDIIGVIEGIAFQTNILALNAAVEAARAGEQGRGFAVVAGEVRTLAQRSATAAKEIKALIDETANRVESGSVLVGEAGRTMNDIVHSIKHVSDIMNEISAASIEQSSGFEQVNLAVSQMDEVTQQNAALVEQASAAAQAMEEQTRSLAQVVSVFKLSNVDTSKSTRQLLPA